jgi:hypothetical protein
MRVPLMFLSERREFLSAPCRSRKKKLMTDRVSMLLKSRASLDMLPFSFCNKKRLAIRHMKRPLLQTTLSIPSYDSGEYVGLRTYQHPLVALFHVTSCSLGSGSFMREQKYVRGQCSGMKWYMPHSFVRISLIRFQG